MKRFIFILCVITVMSCNKDEKYLSVDHNTKANINLEQLASLMSKLELGQEQLQEVYDAVSSSSKNGYDEEYTMRDLLQSPGKGVGDDVSTRSVRTREYSKSMRDLIKEYLSKPSTRANNETTVPLGLSVDEYISYLESSDMQIYWPYYENWDKHTMPLISFDPQDGSKSNIAYSLEENNGVKEVKQVIVTEEIAAKRPVWIINTNDDRQYKSLEILRKERPEMFDGGGKIIANGIANHIPESVNSNTLAKSSAVKLPHSESRISNIASNHRALRTLVLKKFKALRNYDTWFAGASEFFFKFGAIDSFTASTDAELRLYNPAITDFMVIVKRSDVGKDVELNNLIVSDWTEQLKEAAFMLVEDDGGTIKQWNTEVAVKIKSKSYGIVLSLPFNSRDDIVWRGALSYKFLDKFSNSPVRFSDVELTFEFVDN